MTNDPDIQGQPIAAVTPPVSDIVAPPVKGDTQFTGDAKVATQPASMVDPALVPQFKTLGRYTVIGELGRGGMGAVYLAEDTTLKRKVALKIPQFEPRKEEQMRARFIREAQMAAQLSHINICQIYDVGVIDDQLVMAMEYIEGRDLSAFTKPDKLMHERVVVGLVKKIALAVEAAHRKGLVHRDLKPSNIMLSQPDKSKKTVEPKVMDFGLAKSLEPTGQQLTHSGMIVGTPCYMSKEQWSGQDGQLSPQCDVFSLGIILYELLTGKLPYDVHPEEPVTSWFVNLVTKPQIRPSERRPGFDAALETIVMRAIAKEASDRYRSMAELAGDLDVWLKGKSTPAGPTQVGKLPLEARNETPPKEMLLIDFGDLSSSQSAPSPGVATRRQPSNAFSTGAMGVGGGVAALLVFLLWFSFQTKPDGPTKPNGAQALTDSTSEIATQLESDSQAIPPDASALSNPVTSNVTETSENESASVVDGTPATPPEVLSSIAAMEADDRMLAAAEVPPALTPPLVPNLPDVVPSPSPTTPTTTSPSQVISADERATHEAIQQAEKDRDAAQLAFDGKEYLKAMTYNEDCRSILTKTWNSVTDPKMKEILTEMFGSESNRGISFCHTAIDQFGPSAGISATWKAVIERLSPPRKLADSRNGCQQTWQVNLAFASLQQYLADHALSKEDFSQAGWRYAAAETYFILYGKEAPLEFRNDPGTQQRRKTNRIRLDQLISSRGTQEGMYVQNAGDTQTWVGKVIRLEGETLVIRITYSEDMAAEGGASLKEVSMKADSVMPIRGLSVDAISSGYHE